MEVGVNLEREKKRGMRKHIDRDRGLWGVNCLYLRPSAVFGIGLGRETSVSDRVL